MSSTKKGKMLEAGESGEMEAEESRELEMGKLSLIDLKAFPFLPSVVLKAKVDY